MYGGERSADPRLTSFVLIGINAVVWLAIAATGGPAASLIDLLGARAQRDAARRRRAEPATTPRVERPPSARRLPGRRRLARRRRRRRLVAADHQRRSPTSRSGTSRCNMFALLVLGPQLERILGRARFLASTSSPGWPARCIVLWLSDASRLHPRRLRRDLRPARRAARDRAARRGDLRASCRTCCSAWSSPSSAAATSPGRATSAASSAAPRAAAILVYAPKRATARSSSGSASPASPSRCWCSLVRPAHRRARLSGPAHSPAPRRRTRVVTTGGRGLLHSHRCAHSCG